VHSPDFLIAAASVDAIREDRFDLVIGEVHPTAHTVSQPVAQPFCPYRDSVRDEVRDTLGNSRMVAADSDSGISARISTGSMFPSCGKRRCPAQVSELPIADRVGESMPAFLT